MQTSGKHVARTLMFVVIPGRAQREPGIHLASWLAAGWIPGGFAPSGAFRNDEWRELPLNRPRPPADGRTGE